MGDTRGKGSFMSAERRRNLWVLEEIFSLLCLWSQKEINFFHPCIFD